MKIRTSYPGQSVIEVEAPAFLLEQWLEGEVDGKTFEPPFVDFLPNEEEVAEVKRLKLLQLVGVPSEEGRIVVYNLHKTEPTAPPAPGST